MCGVVGLVSKSAVNQELYDALTMLQHRGQDAAGIMTCDNGQLFLRKANGLVRDVFKTRHMLRLRGRVGIGHVRYPTAGSSSSEEAQPFFVNSPYGVTLAHNGNLTNASMLKERLFSQEYRHVNTNSDSEVLLNILAHQLQQHTSHPLHETDIFAAVTELFAACEGGYAAVAMIMNYGLVAFRDPNGIRPLVYGRRQGKSGPEFMVASETVALDALGFEVIADVQPGEVVCIRQDGKIFTQQCAESVQLRPCIFEYVYLSRPDSKIDNISVYKSRLDMGTKLAQKILTEWPEHDIDVIMPIPDTSRTAVAPMAYHLGVKLREGFIKNRYIGRTFIMPGQAARKKSVRQKLNPIASEFRGKNVLLVDDSIVRGTTSREIIQMARDAGARRVYFASAAPPIRYPNVYGIDMPSAQELVAHGRTVAEIQAHLGADRLFYQDLDDLIATVSQRHPDKHQVFETSVFDGSYPVGGVDKAYLAGLEQSRSEKNKQAVAQELDDDDSNINYPQ